jgi:thiamine pyrophosphokinase
LYALVFANGDLYNGPAVRAALDVPKPWLVIAADGGLRHALALHLVPNLVIGDMDSADLDMLAHAKKQGADVQYFPVDKDETDLELALTAAAQRDCDPIRIVGAVGDRLDQTVGNIYLLALPALRGRDVRLVNGKQTTWLAYPGETLIAGQPGDTLSLIPVETEAAGIVTENLEYPLRHETLMFGPARGMSNILLSGEARVTFEGGLLLMTHTRGRA